MNIGFLTACFPRLNLGDLVGWASEKGFHTLELAAWPVASERDYQAGQLDAAHFSRGDAERVMELFDKHHMRISAMAYYENNLHPDSKNRNLYLDHLKKVIDCAHLLGVELVGTFVGARTDKTPKENIQEFAQIFKDIVKYAADREVKMMIENCPMENWVTFGLPGNYAYSPELWDTLFNEIPDDNFGLNFDPSHLYWLGIDYIHAAETYAHKIFHVHAKDTEILPEGKDRFGVFGRQIDPVPWKSGWWRYRLPGLGEIDWKKLITVLRVHEHINVLSIEHEDPVWEGTEDKIKDGLQLGLKHLAHYI